MYERIKTRIYSDAAQASKVIADQIIKLINTNDELDNSTVLGLATGSSPIPVYELLIQNFKKGRVSFRNVVSFNLDEYYPMEPTNQQSYVRFMHEQLFNHIDIKKENIYIPDGTIEKEAVKKYCLNYEDKIKNYGGIDLQLLGIGRTGHIGFNEPGSFKNSRTRLVTLDQLTRKDAAADFNGEENVPRHAITMGLGTILDSEKAILMAWGEHKSSIVSIAIEGKVTDKVPATFLQKHENTEAIIDEAASVHLKRVKTPWLVNLCHWDNSLIKKAVIWLSQKCNRPVLKLTKEDYNKNGLGDLITEKGPTYDINIQVFNQVQHTITGWPGGKPKVDDADRPERSEPFPKRVLVLSPHPDDDVLGMGGTLMRLVEHGHRVNVAYQTSGSNGVSKEEALRFADFILDYNDEGWPGKNSLTFERETLTDQYLFTNNSEELEKIKKLIRKGEAKAAGRYMGLLLENIHFMEMPFYNSGSKRKKPLTSSDIALIISMFKEIKPHQIYAAGDLLDPHGTHRICWKAIKKALTAVKYEDWFENCYVWLYRGVWQEWEIADIDMAVPLSPGELKRKRNAIYKHTSQKDGPLYPGNDSREFWERVNQRNRKTAIKYDKLGLAEYEAIEGFKKWNINHNN